MIIALALRVALLGVTLARNPGGVFTPDSHGYWRLATNLVDHGVFSQSDQAPLDPDHRRTPGYPLFLAPFVRIPSGHLAALAVQILIAAVTCGLVARVGALLGLPRRLAAIAGLIVAIDVPSIALSTELLTETLFTTAVVVAMFVLLRVPARRGAAVSGAMLGIATLVRPIGFLLPLVFAASLVAWGDHGMTRDRRRWAGAAVLVVAAVVTIAPWLVRNTRVFGRPFLSTVGEHNMLYYRAAGVIAVRDGIPLTEAQERLGDQAHRSFPGDLSGNDPAVDLAYKRWEARLGTRIVRDDPVVYARNHARAVVTLLVRPMRSGIDRQLGLAPESNLDEWGVTHAGSLASRLRGQTSDVTLGLVALQILATLVTIPLAALGAWSLRRRISASVLIAGTILYFCVVTGGPEAQARFRVPLVPFFGLLVAFGVGWVGERIGRGTWAPGWPRRLSGDT